MNGDEDTAKEEESTEEKFEEVIIDWIRDASGVNMTPTDLPNGFTFEKHGFFFKIHSYRNIRYSRFKIYDIVIYFNDHIVYSVSISCRFNDTLAGTYDASQSLNMIESVTQLFRCIHNLSTSKK